MEGRQDETAAAQMLGAVEQQHVACADQRPQGEVRLTRVELLRATGEDILDRGGVGEDDPALGEDADGEGVAVAAPARCEEALRIEPVAERLPGDWGAEVWNAHRRVRPIWRAINAAGVWRASVSRRRAAMGLAVWATRPMARDWRTTRSALRLRARS